MIKQQFIKKQTEKSFSAKTTSSFLRRLIFQVVDKVCCAHYAKVYPMKCLQTSAAAQMLLENLGIKSHLTFGAVCVPKIDLNGQFIGWTGFWNEQHHVWIETEFDEVVDLSISYCHQHPSTTIPEMQTPAIWWNHREGGLPIMRYLFDTRIDSVNLFDPQDQSSYEHFVKEVDRVFASTLSDTLVQDVTFSPILSNVEQLNEWTEKQHSWAMGALSILDLHIPFPDWITDRQREMQWALKQGKLPRSRLSDRGDLFEEV